MGVGTSVACITCKKDYYCGYGGYSTNDARKARFPISEHPDHQLVWYNEEYFSEKNGDLISSFPEWEEEVVVPGFSQYEYVDLLKKESG